MRPLPIFVILATCFGTSGAPLQVLIESQGQALKKKSVALVGYDQPTDQSRFSGKKYFRINGFYNSISCVGEVKRHCSISKMIEFNEDIAKFKGKGKIHDIEFIQSNGEVIKTICYFEGMRYGRGPGVGLVRIAWDCIAEIEPPIVGFRIFNNGELMCEQQEELLYHKP